MSIRALNRDELSVVHNIAHATWPSTFAEILSVDQIAYMLNWMYAIPTLEKQFDEGHQFFVMEVEERAVGFIGIQANYPQKGMTKIHKIYILPEMQGLGIGKQLIEHVIGFSRPEGITALTLNVNRYNKACKFYEKFGFTIDAKEDIDIGNGFLMEDYVMRYKIQH
jgi:GNAT superfamily N-acetyltransferase